MGDTKIPKNCGAGSVYFSSILASLFGMDAQKDSHECASALTEDAKATTAGKSCYVEKHSENISDGMPANVWVTYYSVICGK